MGGWGGARRKMHVEVVAAVVAGLVVEGWAERVEWG